MSEDVHVLRQLLNNNSRSSWLAGPSAAGPQSYDPFEDPFASRQQTRAEAAIDPFAGSILFVSG